MTSQCVAHSYLVHALAGIAISFSMIDRCVIHGGLDHVALTHLVLVSKRFSDPHQLYDAFVAKNHRKAAHVQPYISLWSGPCSMSLIRDVQMPAASTRANN